MKRVILLLSVVVLLMACQKPSEFEKTLVADPIKPIMGAVETTDICLADYLPIVPLEQIDSITFDRLISFPAMETLSLEIGPMCEVLDIKANDLHTLFIHSSKSSKPIAIPILPMQMAHKQALITESLESDKLKIRFTEPATNPRVQVYWQNELVFAGQPKQAAEEGSYIIQLPHLNKQGRSLLRIYAVDDNYLYNDVLVPFENNQAIYDVAKLNRYDRQAQVLYSLMIDRFFNGDNSNDWKLNSPEVLDIVDYQGGDLKGITKKIEEGYFNQLGVNTIWISPVTQNPWDAWGMFIFQDNNDGTYNNKYDKSKPYTKFSGYHGYWPILSTAIDKRFGTDADLKELLAVAHKHEMNVILDYVANHLHKDSPTLLEHPDWHTDSILPDGRRNFELWDEARLTTWFDAHIPTLDLEREDVYEPMTDSALYWIANYDLDGFRHDACKHIPEIYWRTLTRKMKTRFPDRRLWMIGETYGSPELINSYVKSGMLDAQFDFNVYFTTIHALVDESGSMRDVEKVIEESLTTYGAHHTMGNISGNHDQVRFASLAGGAVSFEENGKEAGWTRECGIGDARLGYSRALLLEVINLTIPGVPCIYQGDEYAEVGGNDPDNRHLLRFDGLNSKEQEVRQEVSRLIKLRRSSMPLLYGDYIPVSVTDDVLCFKRVYLGESVLVAVNKSQSEQQIEVDGAQITLAPLSYIIRTDE